MFTFGERDCFEIGKDAAFFSPVSKQMHDFGRHDRLDLPLSPISSTETYEKLREKYRVSLQKMVKDKKLSKGSAKQNLIRRQSRADISTMLNDINTIAVTPLKFHTDNSINLMNSMRKNSSRKQKLAQRAALELSAAQKNIADIFSSYFSSHYKRGHDILGTSIMEMTPPTKSGRSRIELLDVHDSDRYLHYTHHNPITTTTIPSVKATTPLRSEMSTAVKRTAKKVAISQRTPEVFRPVLKSPSPLAQRSPAKRANLTRDDEHIDPVNSNLENLAYWSGGMAAEDPSLEALLQGEENPMAASHGGSRRVSSSQQETYNSPVSPKKRSTRDELSDALEKLAEEQRILTHVTPNKKHQMQQQQQSGLLQTCIDFSAKKAASLVRSVQKQDRSLRKSLSTLRPTQRPEIDGPDRLMATADSNAHHDLYDSYMDPMAVSFHQQQQYEQLEAELMQRISPLPAPKFSRSSPDPLTWRTVSTPPTFSESVDSGLCRTPQSSGRGLANVSTGKLIRTASRKSIAASLSSIEQMGLLESARDVDSDSKGSQLRRAVSAPAHHFSPSSTENRFMSAAGSTTPLKKDSREHGRMLHSSSLNDGLDQQTPRVNTSTSTAAAVMNAVRSTLKSRQSVSGRVNDILSRQKPLCTPARQPADDRRCSSLASAMKFDFEVSDEFYSENNYSLSDINRLQSMNSRYSVAPTPGGLTPGKTPRRMERDVKMKALFKSCDSVLSQISSIL